MGLLSVLPDCSGASVSRNIVPIALLVQAVRISGDEHDVLTISILIPVRCGLDAALTTTEATGISVRCNHRFGERDFVRVGSDDGVCVLHALPPACESV